MAKVEGDQVAQALGRTGTIGRRLGAILIGMIFATLIAVSQIQAGVLRRPAKLPTGHGGKARGATVKVTAERAFCELREDGEWHYGLLFDLPASQCSQVDKCSSLDTEYGGRWGNVKQWHLEMPMTPQEREKQFLLIPRTWLIRNGFLPVSVAFHRNQSAEFLDEALLKASFWLEVPYEMGTETVR